MTVGIVSAYRTAPLPPGNHRPTAQAAQLRHSSKRCSDHPGNSGGVLLDSNGQAHRCYSSDRIDLQRQMRVLICHPSAIVNTGHTRWIKKLYGKFEHP